MENQTLNDTIQFVGDTIQKIPEQPSEIMQSISSSGPETIGTLETIVNNAEAFFDPSFFDPATLPLYLLGFVAFVASILDDWLNPKREFKPAIWYVQEFLYTLLSIALGISVCIALEVNSSIIWIVAILTGLIGSSIIRTIESKREMFVNIFVNRLKDKISSDKYGESKKPKTN